MEQCPNCEMMSTIDYKTHDGKTVVCSVCGLLFHKHNGINKKGLYINNTDVVVVGSVKDCCECGKKNLATNNVYYECIDCEIRYF